MKRLFPFVAIAIATRGSGGQLCRNDPIYIRDSTGGSGFGFCTFSGFIPYKKPR
jgi:hypothetical protein